jgi:hypothetical protein
MGVATEQPQAGFDPAEAAEPGNGPKAASGTDAERNVRPTDFKQAVFAASVVMSIGLAISTFPHLVLWLNTGEPVYFADNDDTFYLAFTSQAYHEHPLWISDPTLQEGGETQFPWLQLVPAVLVARGLGLGPAGVLLVWRVWGGLSIGLSLFLLVLVVVRKPWLAAAVAILFLVDSGAVRGRPLVAQALLITGEGWRTGPLEKSLRPDLLGQWRLITPSVSLAFLFAHVALTLLAVRNPTRRNTVLAGLSYGLLYYVYFYFWTASAVALALTCLFQGGKRLVPLRIALIGGVVGLPAVVAGIRVKTMYPTDWLHRTDKFLPIGHTSELLVPWGTILLLAGGLTWSLTRRKDLIYIACSALAGLILLNHQLVTGLQMENFHWNYVLGPFVWLLIVLAAAPLLDRMPNHWLTAGAVTLVAGWCVLGLVLRYREATNFPDTRHVQDAYARYRGQRLQADVPRLVHNETVAGDEDFMVMSSIMDDLRPLAGYPLVVSPSATEEIQEDREALNALLGGIERQAYQAKWQRKLTVGWQGPWGRDQALLAAKLQRVLASYDRVSARLEVELAKYRVRYVALVAGAPAGHLPGVWRKIQSGPNWDVYERSLTLPAPARDGLAS